MRKLYDILQIQKRSVNTKAATIDAVFSTADQDRHGDIVEQKFDLTAYQKNPVILNSHNYSDAGEVIGRATNVKVVDGKLEGSIEFAVAQNPKAKVIFDLYAGGFLNAFSIGFIPKQFDNDGKILESELLEVSAVSVPANAFALAKSKGIEVEKLYEQTTNDEQNQDNNGSSDGAGSDDSEAGQKGDQQESQADAGVTKGQQPAKTKNEEEWDLGDSEIRYKVRDIAEFEKGSFEKVLIQSEMPRVKAVIATPVGDAVKKIQSVMFPKEDGWNIDDARKWVSTNHYMVYNWTNAVEERSTKPSKTKAPLARALSAVAKEYQDRERKRKQVLSKLNNVIAKVSEDVASHPLKADEKQLVNKTIRKLLKIKKSQ